MPAQKRSAWQRHGSSPALQAGAPRSPSSDNQVTYAWLRAQYDDVWERRDVLGVHPQKQAGFVWVGACVPAGRLFASDLREFARVAEECAPGAAGSHLPPAPCACCRSFLRTSCPCYRLWWRHVGLWLKDSRKI